MFPLYWADNIWTSIHFIALSYPQMVNIERQDATMNMLKGLFTNLPCPSCAYHALSYLEEHVPDLSRRESFLQWTIDLHNNVNKRTGKRSDWTIQEFINNFTYNYMSDGSELSRADKKRREDHKYIAELKSRKPFDVINIITLVTSILILLVIIFRIIFEKRRIPKSFFPI